jgi:lipopolysaccharide/colanic/teichoic acid biosynthesis glycosyltransferase
MTKSVRVGSAGNPQVDGRTGRYPRVSIETGSEMAEQRTYSAPAVRSHAHEAPGPAADAEVRLLRPVVAPPLPEVRVGRTPYTALVKPGFDRVAGVLGLIVAAIPMAAVGTVIVTTMGRPIFFRQRRIGRDGVPFEVLKFRTMQQDRRGQPLDVIHDRRRTHKSHRDPRHTAVGRFLRRYSLDELPQLINVARGEMSMVGPRPELESVVAAYLPGLDQRHQVKPGLTGLWQISARGNGPMHENGEWDLAYVQRVSLRTDLGILLRTPAAMLGDNAGN